MLAILHVMLPAQTPIAQHCGHEFTDTRGVLWNWNFTGLAAHGGDYEVSSNGFKYVLNVCRPPLTACRPAGQPTPRGTPTAVQFWGPAPAQCTTPPCTQACSLLGWGPLASSASRFSLIDPAEPSEGIRLTHVGALGSQPPALQPPASPAPANANPSPRTAALDEWGQPRPPLLTVDLVCEPAAPLPAAPLEYISLIGQQPGDTTLKLRTPLACPTHSSARLPSVEACAAAAAAADGSASGGTGRAAAAARSSGGGVSWFAALLSALILAGLLLFGFAPISLKERLVQRMQSPFSAAETGVWPVATEHGDDEDDLIDGSGPRMSGRRRQDGGRSLEMDYRAM